MATVAEAASVNMTMPKLNSGIVGEGDGDGLPLVCGTPTSPGEAKELLVFGDGLVVAAGPGFVGNGVVCAAAMPRRINADAMVNARASLIEIFLLEAIFFTNMHLEHDFISFCCFV